MNLLGSFIQVVFLIKYLPFKQISTLVSSLIGEVCIFFTMLFCYLTYFFQNSLALENLAISTVIIGMVGQFIITLFMSFMSFRFLWLKIKILRAKELLQNLEKNKSANQMSTKELGNSSIEIKGHNSLKIEEINETNYEK